MDLQAPLLYPAGFDTLKILADHPASVYLKTKVAKYFKEKHRVEHDLLKKYKQ